MSNGQCTPKSSSDLAFVHQKEFVERADNLRKMEMNISKGVSSDGRDEDLRRDIQTVWLEYICCLDCI
jgi:hypothetical protein